MKFTPEFCCAFLLSILPLASAEPSSDKPLLQVDFGANTSPVQPGFVAAKAGVGHVQGPLVYDFEGYKTDVTATGLITLTVAGGPAITSTEKLCARDREEGVAKGQLKLGDLYRDFITGPSVITVGISGLKPGVGYKVVFYSFDKIRSLPMEIADYSKGTRGATASIVPDGKLPSPDLAANIGKTASLQVMAPASGQIIFRVTSTQGGSAVLNALSLFPQ